MTSEINVGKKLWVLYSPFTDLIDVLRDSEKRLLHKTLEQQMKFSFVDFELKQPTAVAPGLFPPPRARAEMK
jgi:hypothetical protein